MGKAMNIVDLEKGEYESRLLGSAVLAALHWTMNHSNGQTPLKNDAIAKIEGISTGEVTAKMKNDYNLYTRENAAKQDLAKVIMDFWGAKPDSSVTTSDTDGIAQGVAAELLELMEGSLITTKTEKKGKSTDKKGRTFESVLSVIRVNEDETLTREIKDIGETRSLIADGFVPQSEQPVYIGKAPPNKKTEKQKGNTAGPGISLKNDQALQALRAVERFRNTAYVNFLKEVGMETYVELLGAEEYDPEITHDLHAESMDGRYKNLTRSYTLTMEHDAKVIAYAVANGKNIEDVATHYDYFVAANGRAMAKGFHGQSDKTMRDRYLREVSRLNYSLRGADRNRGHVR
jgi:hypothetical protein